jgi:hypothetical protein
LISLTKNQKEIRQRIKNDIDKEIGMCDDHADLILLATVLYDNAKTIFTSYAQDFGEDGLEKAFAACKKANEE